MVVTTLRGCAMLGADARPLLEVFGEERDWVVRNPRGRCDWNQFAVFQDRVQELLGGPRAMEDMIASVLKLHPVLRMFASLATNVANLYVLGIERIGRSATPHIAAHVQVLDDGSLVVENVIPEHYRGSMAFHNGTVGIMRIQPTLLGLPPAIVEAQATPRRLFARVSLPPSQDIGSRLRRSMALLAERLWQKPWENDAYDVFDEMVLDERGRALTAGIDSSHDLSELHDRVLDCLRQGWCASWARLEWKDGASLQALEGGGPVPEAICARSLTVGDTEVGRLLSDKPTLTIEGNSPLLRKVIVHTAMALDRLRGARPRSGGAGVARLASSWQLTDRQQAVLHLVARGMSNKEIASALGCSVKGVEAHISKLLRRGAISSRTELIVRCHE